MDDSTYIIPSRMSGLIYLLMFQYKTKLYKISEKRKLII